MSRNETLTHVGTVAGIDLIAAHTLAEVYDDWLRFQQTAWFTPFQDIRWLSAWDASHGPRAGYRPFIVKGIQDGRIRFIMPLAIDRRNGVRRLSWLGYEVNDYNCPLVDPDFAAVLDSDVAQRIWAAVASAQDGIDSFHLKHQPAEIAGRANPFLIAVGTQPSACNAHLLTLRKDWKGLHAELRGSKSRRRLREKLNRMRKSGKVSLRCVRDPDERQRAVEDILCWKSAQLELSGDRNVFAHQSQAQRNGGRLRSTIEAHARSSAGHRQMRVLGLYLDGTMIAGLMAFVDRSAFSMFVTALDPRTPAAYSAGTILLVKTMELAARSGIGSYDFLAGEEAYKFDWCNRHLHLMDTFAGLTLLGQVDSGAWRFRLAAKKRIKASATAMTLFRRLNRLYTSLSRTRARSGPLVVGKPLPDDRGRARSAT